MRTKGRQLGAEKAEAGAGERSEGTAPWWVQWPVSASAVAQDMCFPLRASLYCVTQAASGRALPGSENSRLIIVFLIFERQELALVMSRRHEAGAKDTDVMCRSCGQPQN